MTEFRLDPKNPRRLTADELRRLDEAEIDYSDIPPLDEEFFSTAKRALVPNRETIEAMKAAERGEVTKVGHPRQLLRKLNEPDEG